MDLLDIVEEQEHVEEYKRGGTFLISYVLRTKTSPKGFCIGLNCVLTRATNGTLKHIGKVILHALKR